MPKIIHLYNDLSYVCAQVQLRHSFANSQKPILLSCHSCRGLSSSPAIATSTQVNESPLTAHGLGEQMETLPVVQRIQKSGGKRKGTFFWLLELLIKLNSFSKFWIYSWNLCPQRQWETIILLVLDFNYIVVPSGNVITIYNIFSLGICPLEQTSQFTKHLLKGHLFKHWTACGFVHSYFLILRNKKHREEKSVKLVKSRSQCFLFSILSCTQNLTDFTHSKTTWRKKVVEAADREKLQIPKSLHS